MKIVTVSIACNDKDAERIANELNDLQLGLYSFGTEIRDSKVWEDKEVINSGIPLEDIQKIKL
jgi:hypothetical protein